MTVHGAVFYKYHNKMLPSDIPMKERELYRGFSIMSGEITFKSGVFNRVGDSYYSKDKSLSNVLADFLEKTLKNYWDTKQEKLDYITYRENKKQTKKTETDVKSDMDIKSDLGINKTIKPQKLEKYQNKFKIKGLNYLSVTGHQSNLMMKYTKNVIIKRFNFFGYFRNTNIFVIERLKSLNFVIQNFNYETSTYVINYKQSGNQLTEDDINKLISEGNNNIYYLFNNIDDTFMLKSHPIFKNKYKWAKISDTVAGEWQLENIENPLKNNKIFIEKSTYSLFSHIFRYIKSYNIKFEDNEINKFILRFVIEYQNDKIFFIYTNENYYIKFNNDNKNIYAYIKPQKRKYDYINQFDINLLNFNKEIQVEITTKIAIIGDPQTGRRHLCKKYNEYKNDKKLIKNLGLNIKVNLDININDKLKSDDEEDKESDEEEDTDSDDGLSPLKVAKKYLKDAMKGVKIVIFAFDLTNEKSLTSLDKFWYEKTKYHFNKIYNDSELKCLLVGTNNNKFEKADEKLQKAVKERAKQFCKDKNCSMVYCNCDIDKKKDKNIVKLFGNIINIQLGLPLN